MVKGKRKTQDEALLLQSYRINLERVLSAVDKARQRSIEDETALASAADPSLVSISTARQWPVAHWSCQVSDPSARTVGAIGGRAVECSASALRRPAENVE